MTDNGEEVTWYTALYLPDGTVEYTPAPAELLRLFGWDEPLRLVGGWRVDESSD